MSVSTAVPPVAPAASPSDVGALRDEVFRLAGRVAEASEGLRVALRQKERLSRLLDEVLESLQAGVVLLDEGGRLVAANAAAQTVGAVTCEDDPSLPRLAPFLEEASRAEDETILRPPHAPTSTWIVRSGRITLPEGDAGRLLLVQDATRLATAEERSHRRSRLELLGRMAAELAHEVRNPLGSLELFASVLVEDLEPGSETREVAEQLQLGVRTLSGTVLRFLGAARGAERPHARVDAAALVRETIAMLEPVAFSRGIDVRVELPPGTCQARLGVESVRQALLNLIGNALDATPSGGTIVVRLEDHDGELVLDVDDSGPGVSPAEASRIFEPFFTTRDDGTGLGLAVVERVALSHGGSVDVHESPLGGARFRIRLPRTTSDVADETECEGETT